jgi:hypothetical protein
VEGVVSSDPNQVNEKSAEDDSKEDLALNTPKEKECWDLFRHMNDKGITVSFETVLR